MPKASRRLASVATLLLLAAGGPAAQTAAIDATQLMRDLQTLAADHMEGRLVGTPGSARAREFIVRRFTEAGVEPLGTSYEHPFTFHGRSSDQSGVNVLGVVRGRREPNRYIVVTAHYDHLGVRGGQVFNGADDNASGVAALLAVAAQLSADRPNHSVLFAALDAEELGLRGARALLAKPPVPLEQMAMNVNLDMVARDAGNVLYASGTAHYPFLKPLLSDVARPPVVLRFGHDVAGARGDDWTRDSDHFPFHEAGIPYVYFGVEDEAQHHKATDDADTVTPEFFVGAANTILAAIRKIDYNLDTIVKRGR
jgi:Zn-dependent M28 family amino/carboxypeptidase